MARRKRTPSTRPTTRRYESNGVEVEIREAKNRVELKLDGKPIRVSIIDGKFHSQLANQFMAFDSIDDVVNTLLATEGRTWTLHGHVCDERCGGGAHGDASHSHGPSDEHHHSGPGGRR
jgi:hypothetical protein